LMACLPPRDVERVKTFIVDTFDLEAAGLSLVSNHHLTVKVVERMAKNEWLGLKWGAVNLQNLSAIAAVALQKALGDIPDYTAKFSQRTVLKSARELSVISQAAQMARRAALELIRACRPGQSEYQAVSSADRQLRLQGVEDTTILLAAGPEAQALHLPTEREFQSGDTIKVYIAVQYLRYWGAFGTTASIGEPAKAQIELYRKLGELFDNFISNIRGAKEFDASYFSQIKLPKGVVISPYSTLNGIGLDLLEEPCPKQQRWPLSQGMTLNVTLGLDQDGSAGVIASDTLLVEGDSVGLLSGPRPAALLTLQ
jgi:Xaa-Pro aminopeptidase